MRATVYGDFIDLAEELREGFEVQAKAAASDAGQMLTDETRRLLKLRIGTKHTVAPEGEPPEFDEGDLLGSVRKLRTRVTGTMADSGVLINHPGAARLEWGATDRLGRRTVPHPFLRAAVANVEGPIAKMLEERFSAELLVRQDRDVVELRGGGGGD